MDARAEGRVYLGLTYDVGEDGDQHPQWNGHQEFVRRIETGPSLADASDAVRWWRNHGAGWILIRLGDNEHLWAGEGPPPVDDDGPVPIFSDDDPRGRPEGAKATAEAARLLAAEQEAAERSQNAVEEGARLRERREASGLTVEDLASRVGLDPSWLSDVESGDTTLKVVMNQWMDLVWATREPWPDDRRTGSRVGWTACEGEQLAVAEQLVRRHLEQIQQ